MNYYYRIIFILYISMDNLILSTVFLFSAVEQTTNCWMYFSGDFSPLLEYSSIEMTRKYGRQTWNDMQ